MPNRGIIELFRVASGPLRAEVESIRRTAFGLSGSDSQDGIRDRFDEQPNCHTFLLMREHAAIGTVRFCIYSGAFAWLAIPAMEVYPALRDKLSNGSALVQSSHFALKPSERSFDIGPALHVIRELFRVSLVESASLSITIVANTRSRLRFFGRFGFQALGPAIMHPWANQEGILIGASPRNGAALFAIEVSRYAK